MEDMDDFMDVHGSLIVEEQDNIIKNTIYEKN
jgi:hypothetical protein